MPLSRILLASFLSGFASLIYQVVWQRVISQEIGVDLLSTKVTVITFLFGLAIGYKVGANLTRWRGLSSHRLFSLIEFSIGVIGIFSIATLRSVRLASVLPAGYWDLFAVSLLLLLPTFLMGLSTPTLINCLSRGITSRGKAIAKLYALNVLGATVGSLMSGLVLIECFGLQITTVIAVVGNLSAAALLIFARETNPASVLAVPAAGVQKERLPTRIVLISVVLGTVSLGFEMAAFRSIFYFSGLTSFVLPLLLGTFLGLMALGEWFGGLLCENRLKIRPLSAFQLLLILSAIALIITFASPYLAPEAPLSSLISKRALVKLFLFASLFLLPVVFISAYFPLLVEKVTSENRLLAQRASDLLFIFTMANVFGGLLLTFGVLPNIGSSYSLVLIFSLLALAVVLIDNSRKSLLIASGSALLVVACHYNFFTLGKSQQLALVEDATGVYSVDKINDEEVTIRLFNTPTAEAFTKNTVRFQEAIPSWNLSELLMTSEVTPKKVLSIGLGHGLLPYGLAYHPDVKKIDVIELLPTVTKLVSQFSNEAVKAGLKDPKVSLVHEDGRRYLQHLPEDVKYDLVQIGVFHPWSAGASNVFSKEFFQLVKQHLSDQGALIIQKSYPVADKTALSVFGYGYAIKTEVSDRYHYFSLEPIEFAAPTRFLGEYGRVFCSRIDTLSTNAKIFKLEDPKSPDINTDDRPLLEYFALRQILAQLTGITLRPSQDDVVEQTFLKDVAVDCSPYRARKVVSNN